MQRQHQPTNTGHPKSIDPMNRHSAAATSQCRDSARSLTAANQLCDAFCAQPCTCQRRGRGHREAQHAQRPKKVNHDDSCSNPACSG